MGAARRVAATVDVDEALVRRREVEELERQFARPAPGGASASALTDATLTIVRDAPRDVPDRVVNLWLDGERWDVLRYGRPLSRTISPGPHSLKAHNTLVGTTFEFEARPAEHVHLRCINELASGWTFLLIWLGWAALRVHIERSGDAARPEAAGHDRRGLGGRTQGD